MRIVINMHEIVNECARDLETFPVVQKYEIINENEKNYENRPIITTVVPLNNFF